MHMSLRRNDAVKAIIPPEAARVAWLALAEARLRGLAAAEEYRVIADRLYRAGFRDLPSGALLDWIETTVAGEYERLLALRALGERLFGAIVNDDLAQAAWLLASELDRASRDRLIAGLQRLDHVEFAGATTTPNH